MHLTRRLGYIKDLHCIYIIKRAGAAKLKTAGKPAAGKSTPVDKPAAGPNIHFKAYTNSSCRTTQMVATLQKRIGATKNKKFPDTTKAASFEEGQ